MSGGVVAVVSGGMDSVTLAYELRADRALARVVAFDYGQRHAVELGFAERAARRLGVPFDPVDLSALRAHLRGSALTDDAVAVPDGHYAEDTMRATVVPNRNAIMLSVAGGIAVAHGLASVATAVHAGDHYVYPDCRPAFAEAFDRMLALATDGFGGVRLLTPYVGLTKAQIAFRGERLGVPWAETWSCYKGGAVHCGACGTCFERREAFALAGVPDPTAYAAAPTYAAPHAPGGNAR